MVAGKSGSGKTSFMVSLTVCHFHAKCVSFFLAMNSSLLGCRLSKKFAVRGKR